MLVISGLLVLSKNIRHGETNFNSSFQRQAVQGIYRCCPIFQAVLIWSGEKSKSMKGFGSHRPSRTEANIRFPQKSALRGNMALYL